MATIKHNDEEENEAQTGVRLLQNEAENNSTKYRRQTSEFGLVLNRIDSILNGLGKKKKHTLNIILVKNESLEIVTI